MAIPSCNTCERDKASEQDTQSQIEATNFRLRFPFELAASFIWSQSEKEKRGKKKKEKKKKKEERKREWNHHRLYCESSSRNDNCNNKATPRKIREKSLSDRNHTLSSMKG